MPATSSWNNVVSAKVALVEHMIETRHMRDFQWIIESSLQQVSTAPQSSASKCATERPVQKQRQCRADLEVLKPFAVESQLVLIYCEGEEVDIGNAFLLLLNQHVHSFKKPAITVATLL